MKYESGSEEKKKKEGGERYKLRYRNGLRGYERKNNKYD